MKIKQAGKILNQLDGEQKIAVQVWMLHVAELILQEYAATDEEERKDFDVVECWNLLKTELANE